MPLRPDDRARRSRAPGVRAPRGTRVEASVGGRRALPSYHRRAARERRPRKGFCLDEARKAAVAKQWRAVIALCADALALDGPGGDAAALKRKAEEAIEAEERKRVVEGERALGRAEAHWRKQRFQEAMLELERARGFSPNATALHAFEERLRESIARTECNNQLAREADEAIAAARRAFLAGNGIRRFGTSNRFRRVRPNRRSQPKSAGSKPRRSALLPRNTVPQRPRSKPTRPKLR